MDSHLNTIVDFESPQDPFIPLNWPLRKKALQIMMYILSVFSFCVSWFTYQPDTFLTEPIQSDKIGRMLFVTGFMPGSLVWVRLAEIYGRKRATLIPGLISAIFALGIASSKNVYWMQVCRFFTGFCGVASVTNVFLVIDDLFRSGKKALPYLQFAISLGVGAYLGSILSNYFANTGQGWRLPQYITGFLILGVFILNVLFIDESSATHLLARKARRLRQSTGNRAFHARHDDTEVRLTGLISRYFILPVRFLSTPIGFFMALYSAFSFFTFFGFLSSASSVLRDQRHWSDVTSILAYVALFLGICLAIYVDPKIYKSYYVSMQHKNKNRPVPEARLLQMMMGAVSLPAGLFLYAWAAPNPVILVIWPLLGAFMVGFGFFLIYQSVPNYLTDSFERHTPSASAVITLTRTPIAVSIILATSSVVNKFAIRLDSLIWTSVAALLGIIPFVFFYKGETIRSRSKWTRDPVYSCTHEE